MLGMTSRNKQPLTCRANCENLTKRLFYEQFTVGSLGLTLPVAIRPMLYNPQKYQELSLIDDGPSLNVLNHVNRTKNAGHFSLAIGHRRLQ